jgi:hypothetical protein
MKQVKNTVKSDQGKTNNQKKRILFLGSSHGRKVGHMLQEILSKEYEVTTLFKPNAPLANVVEDLTKLGKTLPSGIMLL